MITLRSRKGSGYETGHKATAQDPTFPYGVLEKAMPACRDSDTSNISGVSYVLSLHLKSLLPEDVSSGGVSTAQDLRVPMQYVITRAYTNTMSTYVQGVWEIWRAPGWLATLPSSLPGELLSRWHAETQV